MSLKHRAKMAFMAVLGVALSGVISPVLAAGTIPLAMAVQFDTQGNVAAGCKLTLYQAGTVATKQNVYFDFGLTQVAPNPLNCDQSGRVPMFWLADGLIHAVLTTSSGTDIIDTTMQVLGPSSGGGGGGGTVDPTTVMSTGDVKARYGTGPLSGFVRLNGLTIGSSFSGATERANADTQSLFVYLCQTDPNLVVSSGRSGNCLNDYNANKTITLPDARGRVIGALADMGNSAASWLTSTYFGATPTTLGAVSTTTDHTTLVTSNLPPYTPAGSIANGAITIGGTAMNIAGLNNNNGGGGGPFAAGSAAASLSASQAASSFTGFPQGGTSTPFSSVQPTLLMTVYMKL